MAECLAPDLALVMLPDSDAVPMELDIATGGDGTQKTLYHCPIRLESGTSIGHLTRKAVPCPLRPGQECPVIQKIADDRQTSYKNVLHFGSDLPTTAPYADPDSTGILIIATRWKR